jgi:hypothetical protein
MCNTRRNSPARKNRDFKLSVMFRQLVGAHDAAARHSKKFPVDRNFSTVFVDNDVHSLLKERLSRIAAIFFGPALKIYARDIS